MMTQAVIAAITKTVGSGTITEGYVSSGGYDQYGFISGTLGSTTGSTLSDGKTVVNITKIVDVSPPFITASVLKISGFTEDPGIGYLSSISVGATTLATVVLGSSASYSYSAAFGIATWQWSSGFGVFPLDGFGTTSWTIQ